MSSSLDKVTVVLCHGLSHTPEPYKPLTQALKTQDFISDVYCPQLPTSDHTKLNIGDDINNPDFDRSPPPNGYPTNGDDAKVIIQLLEQLINDDGQTVLLIAHSAGGWTASEAARPELQAKNRLAEGKSGGVIGIVYIGALLIPAGESVLSFFQPKEGSSVIPPWVELHKHGLGTFVNPRHYLFNDLDEISAQRWIATLTAFPILPSKLTHDPYAALSCAYVVLEKDEMLPPAFQERMIAGQSEKSKTEFTVYRAPTGHSPFLSWTEGLVGLVGEFVRKIMA